MVRCKFQCQKVEKSLHWDRSGRFLYTAEFSVVSSGDEENKKFFEATPFGTIKVGTFKEDFFTPGKFYYVDINEVLEFKDTLR